VILQKIIPDFAYPADELSILFDAVALGYNDLSDGGGSSPLPQNSLLFSPGNGKSRLLSLVIGSFVS
jgi:hypothetical protein